MAPPTADLGAVVVTDGVVRECEGAAAAIKTGPPSSSSSSIASPLPQPSLKSNQALPFSLLSSPSPRKDSAAEALSELSRSTGPPKKRRSHSSSQEGELDAPVTAVENNGGSSPSSVPSPPVARRYIPRRNSPEEEDDGRRDGGMDDHGPRPCSTSSSSTSESMSSGLSSSGVAEIMIRQSHIDTDVKIESLSLKKAERGVGRETPPPAKAVVKVTPQPPNKINVVTQNTSDEEDEAATIIADEGSHRLDGEETTAEGLMSQLSQESFNHDGKGESQGGRADHLSKTRQESESQSFLEQKSKGGDVANFGSNRGCGSGGSGMVMALARHNTEPYKSLHKQTTVQHQQAQAQAPLLPVAPDHSTALRPNGPTPPPGVPTWPPHPYPSCCGPQAWGGPQAHQQAPFPPLHHPHQHHHHPFHYSDTTLPPPSVLPSRPNSAPPDAGRSASLSSSGVGVSARTGPPPFCYPPHGPGGYRHDGHHGAMAPWTAPRAQVGVGKQHENIPPAAHHTLPPFQQHPVATHPHPHPSYYYPHPPYPHHHHHHHPPPPPLLHYHQQQEGQQQQNGQQGCGDNEHSSPIKEMDGSGATAPISDGGDRRMRIFMEVSI